MGLTTIKMVAEIDPGYYKWIAVALGSILVGAVVVFVIIRRLFRPRPDKTEANASTGFGLDQLRRMFKSGLISEQEFKELRNKTLQKTSREQC